MSISRRSFVAGAVAGSSLALAAPAIAKAPPYGRQVPSVYRHTVGIFEVIALNDGAIEFPISYYPKADPAQAAAVLEATGAAPDKVPTTVNAFLVNTGEKLVLIDSGAGKLFGPTLGRFAANLAALGVDPASVDIIAMTHLHPDHIGGLLNDQAALAFPNAQILISEADVNFWLNEAIAAKAPADTKPLFDNARMVIGPYITAQKYMPIVDGEDVVPGMTAVAAPGHTPGHTMYRITSGSDALLIWGDVIHSADLQFAHPDWAIAFDVDSEAATVMRKKVFDMTATDRLAIAGAHVPFPGIGHVGRASTAYEYLPLFWTQG
jgi:glyoxylase-like metal-dependent hydrolase (beta-lactamase superfamily II)